MTDQEKFKKTFGTMHASPDILTEVMNMTSENVRPIRVRRNKMKIAAAVVACILVLGAGTTVYAMNVGGIQRIVQVWFHGDQTDATLNVYDDFFTLDVEDGEISYHKEVYNEPDTFNEDGTPVEISEEELLEHLNDPEVVYEEDGSVWVYYYDQKMEITDKFEDGICYCQVKHDDKTFYLTVKYQEGYSMSTDCYIEP